MPAPSPRARASARILHHPHAGLLERLWHRPGRRGTHRQRSRRVSTADMRSSTRRTGQFACRARPEASTGSLAEEASPRRRITRLAVRWMFAIGASMRRSSFPAPTAQPDQVREAAFDAEHRKLYGYVHEGRELEIVAVRVEARGRSSSTAAALPERRIQGQRRSDRTVRASMLRRRQHRRLGSRCSTATHPRTRRPSARAGHRLRIGLHHASSIRDWEAEVARRGGRAAGQYASDEGLPVDVGRPQVDPVMLEIFNNQFAAIAEQMGITLRNTAEQREREGAARFQLRRSSRRPATWWSTRRTFPCIWGDGRRRCAKALIADNPTDATGRRVRHQRPVSRRLAPARRDRGHAGSRRAT